MNNYPKWRMSRDFAASRSDLGHAAGRLRIDYRSTGGGGRHRPGALGQRQLPLNYFSGSVLFCFDSPAKLHSGIHNMENVPSTARKADHPHIRRVRASVSRRELQDHARETSPTAGFSIDLGRGARGQCVWSRTEPQPLKPSAAIRKRYQCIRVATTTIEQQEERMCVVSNVASFCRLDASAFDALAGC